MAWPDTTASRRGPTLSAAMERALEGWAPLEVRTELELMALGVHGQTLRALVARGLVAPTSRRRAWRRRETPLR